MADSRPGRARLTAIKLRGKGAAQQRSAGLRACCIAGFQTGPAQNVARAADLEIGDTAGLETCATILRRLNLMAVRLALPLEVLDRTPLSLFSWILDFGI